MITYSFPNTFFFIYLHLIYLLHISNLIIYGRYKLYINIVYIKKGVRVFPFMRIYHQISRLWLRLNWWATGGLATPSKNWLSENIFQVLFLTKYSSYRLHDILRPWNGHTQNQISHLLQCERVVSFYIFCYMVPWHCCLILKGYA